MTTTEDPGKQYLKSVRDAHSAVRATEILLDVQRNDLRRVIREARGLGLSLSVIAELLGVSRQRVAQLSE